MDPSKWPTGKDGQKEAYNYGTTGYGKGWQAQFLVSLSLSLSLSSWLSRSLSLSRTQLFMCPHATIYSSFLWMPTTACHQIFRDSTSTLTMKITHTHTHKHTHTTIHTYLHSETHTQHTYICKHACIPFIQTYLSRARA